MDKDTRANVEALIALGYKDQKIARRLGLTRYSVRQVMYATAGYKPPEAEVRVKYSEKGDKAEASGVVAADSMEHSLDALLEQLDVDLELWAVDRWVGNRWGSTEKPMWQVKAWFKRKPHEEVNLEQLIKRLEDGSPVQPLSFIPFNRQSRKPGRCLEISIADPHFGMRTFAGASGHNYDFDSAAKLWKVSIDKLIDRAMPFGLFDEIVFVAGNDYLHVDGVFHTTTAGTPQPEADAWQNTFERGEELLISTVKGLSKLAPVKVVVVPGNHARQSEFALGRVLNAYFHNDANVEVDCGAEPYKFHFYGVNLIGYEHGHSIKAHRLASLMANERPDAWACTWQREWHCGDQHRESAQFSEFGVNIKYLPSFATWNSWAKIKSFSWAHRASLGFVYDKVDGLISTPQVNAREIYG